MYGLDRNDKDRHSTNGSWWVRQEFDLIDRSQWSDHYHTSNNFHQQPEPISLNCDRRLPKRCSLSWQNMSKLQQPVLQDRRCLQDGVSLLLPIRCSILRHYNLKTWTDRSQKEVAWHSAGEVNESGVILEAAHSATDIHSKPGDHSEEE